VPEAVSESVSDSAGPLYQ